MGLWTVLIGQGGSQRAQERVADITVSESFGHCEFVVTVVNPISDERAQIAGRIDAAIIQINRGSDILVEGYIEDVEGSGDYVKFSGRSFLSLTGYSPESTTDGSGDTEATYEDDTGKYIIDDLIHKYCYPYDNEIAKHVTFPDEFKGEFPLHGKKIYQIIREMCQMYGYDFWSDATWSGANVTAKNIRVGTKGNGTSGAPHKVLYGGQHLRDIPVIKTRSSQAINSLRVIGGGSGKDKVSVMCIDAASIAAIGRVEGEPYHNNMIRTVETAEAVGNAIITAKKDPIEELRTNLAMYISDLGYGDWIRIVDTHSGLDTTKRIKKIVRFYNTYAADAMSIELGEKFDDYQNIVRDLTKGDVDAEPEMTKAGGSFCITANNPPSDYVRVDEGAWYDTTGIFRHRVKGICSFWQAGYPSNNAWKKAIVQISDGGTISSKYSASEFGTYTDAQNDILAADALNTPLGEVILHGDSGKPNNIDEIYDAYDGSNSYIYLDARPIIGSQAGSGGGGLWEYNATGTAVQTIGTKHLDMLNQTIMNIGMVTSGPAIGIALYDNATQLRGRLASNDHALKCFNKGVDMNSQSITTVKRITMEDATSIIDANMGTINNISVLTMLYPGNVPLLVMNDGLITGLADPTTAKGATNKQWVEANTVTNPMTVPLDMASQKIDNAARLDASAPQGVSFYDSAGTPVECARLATSTSGLILYRRLYVSSGGINMVSNDITGCKNISGLTTGTNGANRLNLDFRGDANHRIYYTGASDNRLGYKTAVAHAFAIGATTIMHITSAGAQLTGKLETTSGITFDSSTGKIKIEENDSTGDMEFTVQTGDAFVFKTVA